MQHQTVLNKGNRQEANSSQQENLTTPSHPEKKKKRKPNRKWIPKHIFRKQKQKSLKKKVNIVHNFSSIQLSEAALNKGFNFCPAQKGVNYTQLLADLFRLERKMAWRHHFKDYNSETTSDDTLKYPFPNKKQKTNHPSEYPKEISEFISSVRSDLIGSEKKHVYSNLSKEEWEAFGSLIKSQKDGSIVIQPADKNGGICILDREDYIEEGNRQLNDKLVSEDGEEESYYKKTNEKSVKDQYNKIEKVIDEGIELGYFSK